MKDASRRLAWFTIFMAYLKLRTFEIWFQENPFSSPETFEFVWPTLFDGLCKAMTTQAVEQLHKRVEIFDD